MAFTATAAAASWSWRRWKGRGRGFHIFYVFWQEEKAAKIQCVLLATDDYSDTHSRLDIVYSQPADTGTGQNVNTQLVYAVNHLKSTGNPMRLQDLAIITSIPIDTDRALLEKFRSHDRVVHDPKTDLYSYRVRGGKGVSCPV